MTLTAEGWFDWAERHPGPANKVWPDPNALEFVVMHSAVGSGDGVVHIVDIPYVPTDDRTQRSVTGVIYYDGRLVQFYPVMASPWANGSHDMNRRGLGFENEGGADLPGQVSEPQTAGQLAASIRILQDLAAFKGVGVDFWQRPTTLKEHREFYATACPSGRIRWNDIIAGLNPVPGRIWLYGDESAGLELVGKQQRIWNQGVNVDRLGSEDGTLAGTHLHNEAGVWVVGGSA